MESLNRMSTELIDEALEFTDELAIDAYELENGATVLDFGVDAIGGLEAGLLLTEIQTAGLATVASSLDEIGGAPRPFVELSTDHPARALLCSQKAGWEISTEGESTNDGANDDGNSNGNETVYEGLGSGPARALVAT